MTLEGQEPRARRTRAAAERQMLDRMMRLLQLQGRFDSADARQLDDFLEATTYELTLDWSPVLESFSRFGPRRLAEKLKQRLAPPVVFAVRNFLERGHTADEKWAILVGAGGSKPPPSNIPTVTELLRVLWDKAAAIDAPSLLRMKDKCDELGITNIEELLTAVSLAQSAVANPKVTALVGNLLYVEDARPELDERSEGVELFEDRPARRQPAGPELVESLSESSQTLFSVLVGMMKEQPPNPIHDAVALRVKEHSGDVVITTNYDVCLEKAIHEGAYDYMLDPTAVTAATPLLKLHGSLSWYACKSCDRYITAKIEQIDAASHAGLYPVVAMCPRCAATAQQLIMPPIGAKYAQHPVLLDIRQQAEQAFRDSGSVVVIGYSFSEADQYIQRMLGRALDTDPNKIVLIFDRSSGPVDRLRRFLARRGSSEVDRRVLGVIGPAEEHFPAFLAELATQQTALKTQVPAAPHPATSTPL